MPRQPPLPPWQPHNNPPRLRFRAGGDGAERKAGGTQITVGRGTSGGAAAGMKGSITGVPNGGFTLAACTERTCTATVPATPDQIKSSGQVVLRPPRM